MKETANVPSYRYTLLPSGMVGANAMTCEWCGALVVDESLHTRWHNPFARPDEQENGGTSDGAT